MSTGAERHIFYICRQKGGCIQKDNVSRLSTNTDLKIRFLSKMLPKVLVCNFRGPVPRENYCRVLRTSNQPWGEVHTAGNQGYPPAASTA